MHTRMRVILKFPFHFIYFKAFGDNSFKLQSNNLANTFQSSFNKVFQQTLVHLLPHLVVHLVYKPHSDLPSKISGTHLKNPIIFQGKASSFCSIFPLSPHV